jgi:hypothetical protein
MRTIRRDWQELRSCAVVMLLIVGVSATTVISCGGGGGDSSGELCQQCGDSDGPCQDTVEVTGDARPGFCLTPVESIPCTVELRCLRKLDSAQRRCFPADPATNAVDILYRCDGARPNPSVVPTTTPTPVPTFTSSAAPTPTSTGATATGVTATPSGSIPTPAPTATPDEIAVTITIDTNDEFTSSFNVTVMYPPSKGDFLLDGAPDCDPGTEEFTPEDNGSGTLTLAFLADSARTFAVDVDCTFHQDAGQTLVNSDLTASANPSSLTVEINPL